MKQDAHSLPEAAKQKRVTCLFGSNLGFDS